MSRHRYVERLFVCVSRLGDGVFWYGLMLFLPLFYDVDGLKASIHMGLVGLLCVWVYRKLKSSLVRERPFVSWQFIRCGTQALDRYSFSSGHTLQAVAFNTLLFIYFPVIGWTVLLFTILVALSRVVLGLHYPSDVLAGALIGLALSSASVIVILMI